MTTVKHLMSVKSDGANYTLPKTESVFEALKSPQKCKIEVVGEEDLAVIPVIHFAPVGGIVIYGMPNKGVVMINVSEKDKEEVKKIIKEMEV